VARHQESSAKQATRRLILHAAKMLGRSQLTYLGMPAENAYDIIELQSVLQNVICIAEREDILEETRRSISGLPLHQRLFFAADIWKFLQLQYQGLPLTADVTFLDFYGGGITAQDPFASEINGLRNYFAKQASLERRAFVFAWTYMPRDKGETKYIATLEKILPKQEIDLLRSSTGVSLRSLAIRLLLAQHAREHDMNVKLVQHALYKRVMNTIILVLSRGTDPQCSLTLGSPDELYRAPCCVYDGISPAPRLVSLLK
jgi:hypothetical protein